MRMIGGQRFMAYEQILLLSMVQEQWSAVYGKTRRGQMPAYASHCLNTRQKNVVARRRSVGNNRNISRDYGQKLPENPAGLRSGLRAPSHRGQFTPLLFPEYHGDCGIPPRQIALISTAFVSPSR